MESELIGREEELAAIEGSLGARSGGVLLEGEAGIGKTSVWLAGVERARELGFEVLAARPAQAEAQISFGAVADLLSGASGLLEALPEPQRRALEIALLLREPEGAPPTQQEIAFALLSALRSGAEASPLLVAVDDVQWLDGASAAALQFALRRVGEDEPLVVLLARRTDDHGREPLELDRLEQERLARVPLAGLSLGALQRLLGVRLGGPLSRPLLRRLHELSGGNPFFALELARYLQQHPHDERAELPLPDSLHELLSGRLAALPQKTTRALVAAAVAGAPTLDLVEGATGADAAGALRPAVEAGVVSLDGERIQFAHPLLARAVYDEVGPGRRREVHGALAELVSDPEERARHLALSAAGPSAEVAAAVHEGALEAFSRGAPAAAAELLEHALALSPGEQRSWKVELANARYSAGDVARAQELLRELAGELEPGPEHAAVLWRLGQVEGELAGSEAEQELYEQALAEADGDDALRARLEVGLARMRTFGGAPPEGVEHAARAVELAEQAGDDEVLAEALAVYVLANRYAGRELPREVIERAVALEQGLARPPSVDSPSSVYSLELRTNLELDRAREVLERHLAQVTTLGDETTEPMVLFRLFDTELLSGRWDRAAWCAARMRELAEPSGAFREYARLATALVDAHRGDLAQAREAALAGLAFAEGSGETPLAHHNRALLGFLDLSQGEPGRAADELLRWEAVVRELDFRDPYHLLRGAPNEAEALTEAGKLDEAARVLDWFEEAAREAGRDWPSAFVARGRGLLHAAAGEPDAALALLEPLPASQHLAVLPFERARTLLLLGVVRRRDKRRREAREALAEAQAAFASLGASTWEARAAAEAARIGGRTPSGDELTVSERRIAERVAAGKQNKEVAAELFVSVSTVEAALTRIYAKLGVRSRTELAALLVTLKL